VILALLALLALTPRIKIVSANETAEAHSCASLRKDEYAVRTERREPRAKSKPA
jgi:hypothetical protein